MSSVQIKAKIHDFIFSNAKSVKGYQPTVKLSSINKIPAGFFIFILHARYNKIHARQCIIKMYNLHPSRIIQNS